MKAFEYADARTEAEVLQLLADNPAETELIAGGTDLVGLMRSMVIAPGRVINILPVTSMQSVERLDDGYLAIGAVVHLDELLEHPELDDYPAVTDAVRGIASMQLRAQGTLGGELCQRPQCWYFRSGHGLLADAGRRVLEGDSRFHAILGNSGPAQFVSSSRIAPALIALRASVRIVGPGAGDAVLRPLVELYRVPYGDRERELSLRPGQFVSHVVIPPKSGWRSSTYEVRQGTGPDFPLAAAAAALMVEAGTVRRARLVLGQVAPIPWVAESAAHGLIGKSISSETARAAGRSAVSDASPTPANRYKVQLAAVAAQRAILAAAGLPTGGLDEMGWG
jgi:xanthine dehydrogenase YagS FAD-binding subunit